jgi:hypothetical protein
MIAISFTSPNWKNKKTSVGEEGSSKLAYLKLI